MPVALFPECQLEFGALPVMDDYQVSPAFWWQIPAGQVNLESGSAVDGRYHEGSGEIEGRATPKAQDTYKFGTGGRTGRAFDVIAGTVKDDLTLTDPASYGLFMPDGGLDAAWEVKEHAVFSSSGITHSALSLWLGTPHPDATRDTAHIYRYLELADGDAMGNYRIALEWGQPVRLDYQSPGSATWQIGVAIASKIGLLENYLAHNDHWLRLRIAPDRVRNIMWVEVGDGNWLRHAPGRPANATPDMNGTIDLPQSERLRFYGKNGAAALWVFPLRHAAVSVTSAKRPAGDTIPNISEAQILPQALDNTQSGSAVSGAVAQDENGDVSALVTASQPDAGDGLGSADPARFAGVTVYVPSVWEQQQLWLPVGVEDPPCMWWEELHVLDDITRAVTRTCRFVVNNRTGRYNGTYGNYAFALAGTNGIISRQRMRGIIAGGFTTHRLDPMRIMTCAGYDASRKLTRPLGKEIVVDGWCLYDAAHEVLDAGQVSPRFRARIPRYGRGPASYDCPYPILGRGTGNRPIHRYYPDQSCLSVLLTLVSDASDYHPVTGRLAPIFTGQDMAGNWLFEPYDPGGLLPVKAFSANDPSGLGQILEIKVYNSVDHMRTDIDLQGQDPYTGELLFLHLPMPWNLPAVGYRYPYLERNTRWATREYLQRIGQSAMIQASLPQQVVNIKTIYDPILDAGQLIYVDSPEAEGWFVITMLHSQCGLLDWSGRRGEQECYAWITARSAANLLPA